MKRLGDIVGHEQSLSVLRRSLAEARLHHSWIFHGPEAVGKRTAAMALAAALNCAGSAGRGRTLDDACGDCPSCRKVDKGIHADVRYVTLEKTVIPIDSIRKIRQEAAYRPFEGRRRVFIIDPADRLSIDAQNALLKTLEEPSASSCIILITSRLMRLLPTTRSRCQSLPFGTVGPQRLADHLAQAHDLPPEEAARAARLSGGRYGAALELDLEKHDAARQALLEVLERLAQQRPRDHVLSDVDAFGGDAQEIASRLELLGGLVRDMMMHSAGAPAQTLIHADLAGELAGLAQRFSPRLEAILERIRLASSDLDRNVNRKLLIETLMFDIAQDGAAS